MAAFAVMPSVAASAALERLCRFERQILDGVSRVVDLPVIVDSSGGRGEVLIGTGARYPASIQTSAAGAMVLVFSTGVSRETMTIGPGGETLWQINFNDGKTMAYAGSCGPNRKR